MEVGDYVRTNRGIIAKVVYIRPKNSFKTKNGYRSNSPERYYLDSIEVFSIIEKNLKKHSKNIIDLIEVGDYVNGYEVVPLYYDKDENIDILGVEVIDNGYGYIKELADINIRTILTHEMYEKNCYKLKE